MLRDPNVVENFMLKALPYFRVIIVNVLIHYMVA